MTASRGARPEVEHAFLGVGLAVVLMYASSRAYRRQHPGFASEIGVYVGLIGAAVWAIGSVLLAKEPAGDPEHDRLHYDKGNDSDNGRRAAGR